jgi:MYXO-CTERM domain-containing protein
VLLVWSMPWLLGAVALVLAVRRRFDRQNPAA